MHPFEGPILLKTSFLWSLHILAGPPAGNPEPTNSQNDKSKQVLHGLCSPPTGKMALLQAVQILLLSLRNKRSHFHGPASRDVLIRTRDWKSQLITWFQTRLSWTLHQDQGTGCVLLNIMTSHRCQRFLCL